MKRLLRILPIAFLVAVLVLPILPAIPVFAASADRQVDVGANDCWRGLTNPVWDLSAVQALVGSNGATEKENGSGNRFTNITIPKGSTINTAHIHVTALTTLSGTLVKSRISAEDIDDAPVFADSAATYDSRWATRTSARIDWDDIPSWTVDVEYESPSIVTVIQEVIDRAGWVSGNDIAIFWDDHEGRTEGVAGKYRTSYSYENTPAKTMKLHVTYTPPSSPTVIADVATSITSTTATLNGEVTATGGDNPTVTVYWGNEDGGETPGSWDNNSIPTSPSQPQGAATFYKDVTSLSANTIYFFKAKATNSVGAAWTVTRSFTTGWLTGWGYRKEFTIDGTTDGAQTNYPMKLNATQSPDWTEFRSSWDLTEELYNPSSPSTNQKVIKIGSTYFMYYSHSPEPPAEEAYNIYLATSSSPTSGFTQYGSSPVLVKGDEGAWDSTIILAPYVVEDSGTYYMFYDGSDTAVHAMGYATSADGYTWTKQTVSTYLFDYTTQSWSDSSGGTPALIKKGSTWYLFYHGWDGTPLTNISIGYATSSSIVGTYTPYGSNPVLTKSGAGWEESALGKMDIFLYGDTYVMFYEGEPDTGPGEAQIGIATSADLTTWTKDSAYNPVFVYADWEGSTAIAQPTVLIDGDDYYVYVIALPYNGVGVYKLTPSGASGDTVSLDGHNKDDFGDVRFTTSGGALLDYWIESYVSDTSAIIWVELDSIPASPSSASFYIYYGNSGASTTSDGEATFTFFDDFPGSSIDTDKWSGDTGYATVASSILTYKGTGAASKAIYSDITTGSTTAALRTRAQMTTGYAEGIGLRTAGTTYIADLSMNDVDPYGVVRTMNNVTPSTAASNLSSATYVVWDVITNANTNATFYENGVALTGSPRTEYLPNRSDMSAHIDAYEDAAYLLADWILLRNWTSTEPTWGDWGIPGATVPTITTSAATSVTSTTATLNGNITSVGSDDPTVTVYWGSSDGGTTPGSWEHNSAPTSPSQPQGVAAFYYNVTSLSPGTKVYFNAKATNTSGTVWGATRDFTTDAGAPTVATGTAVTITSTGATLQGTLVSLGNYSTVYVYFEYGPTPSYGTATGETTLTAVTGFSEAITGLETNTTYYFRAVARYGTTSYVYGAGAQFSTSGPGAPGIDPPDILRIDDIKVFTNYMASDDQLYVIAYRIVYNSGTPIMDVSDYFDFQLLDGTTLKAQTPVKSWDYKPGSIYLIASSAPAWGGEYTIKIVGNPNEWETPPETTRDLTSGDWQGSDLAQLDTWVISLAESLQSYYNSEMVVYTVGGTPVLSAQGGVIFNMSIPGLSTQRPHLFRSRIEYPEYEKPVREDTLQPTLDPREKLGPYITDIIEDAGELVGQDLDATIGWSVGALYVVGAVIIGIFTGLWVVGFAVLAPVALAGMWIGGIPVAGLMLVAAIVVMFVLKAVWLRGT